MCLQHTAHGSRMILGQTKLLDLLAKAGRTAAIARGIREHVMDASDSSFAIVRHGCCERSDCSFL